MINVPGEGKFSLMIVLGFPCRKAIAMVIDTSDKLRGSKCHRSSQEGHKSMYVDGRARIRIIFVR
jgi:hypothetical protein